MIWLRRKGQLAALANYHKLEINSGMTKGDVRRVVCDCLVDENVVSDEDVIEESSSTVALRRIELQEKGKEQEAQFHLKGLEIKEREIAVQLKVIELELATAPAKPPSATKKFEVTRHVRFVPPFQETEPDKYFLHFEKIATSLHWPAEVWTLLLQSKLEGKAREI